MRKVLLLLFALIPCALYAQPFNMPVPDGWTAGIIPFPLDFAPAIKYTGEEYVRTAPAWRDPGSENLWSYCYLWWIKNDAKINEESLQRDLSAYYGGLVARNIISRQIDSTLVVPTVVSIAKTRHEPDYGKSFMGTIKMLDYLSLRPITLNVRIHLRTCEKHSKLAVLFEVSPQPVTHPVWEKFKTVHAGFRCAP